MRTLVVEDSPTAAMHLKLKLQGMGHEVEVIANGRDAWEHLARRHETLIITDWMMPGMDGLELCRKVRTLEGVPYSYMILLTVKDLRKDRLQGLQAGADDFLTKPVDTVELAAALLSAERVLKEMKRLQDRVAALEAASGLVGPATTPAMTTDEPVPAPPATPEPLVLPAQRWGW